MIEKKLEYPIVIKNDDGEIVKKIESVYIEERLKAKHFKRMPDGLMEKVGGGKLTEIDSMLFLQAILGLTDDEFGEIDIETDLPSISEMLPDFLKKAP